MLSMLGPFCSSMPSSAARSGPEVRSRGLSPKAGREADVSVTPPLEERCSPPAARRSARREVVGQRLHGEPPDAGGSRPLLQETEQASGEPSRLPGIRDRDGVLGLLAGVKEPDEAGEADDCDLLGCSSRTTGRGVASSRVPQGLAAYCREVRAQSAVAMSPAFLVLGLAQHPHPLEPAESW
jgi:hypothetical protein